MATSVWKRWSARTRGKGTRQTGEVARIDDRKSARQRLRIDRETALHFGVALVFGAVALAAIIRFTPPPEGDPLLGVFLPGVVVLALLFETADSASGMGFGTALAPLLFLMDYEPRQVVPVILISEAVTGLVAGWFHHRLRNVEVSFKPFNRPAVILVILLTTGLVGVVGSVVVTYRLRWLPEEGIKIYVAVLVLVMGVVGLLHGRVKAAEQFHGGRLIGFAALAGINKGIGGGGYGPVVTMGEIFAGVYEKTAAAITNLSEGVVALAGAIAFFTLALTGGEVYFGLLPSVFLGGYLGALLAPYLLRVIPNRVWRYVIPTYALVIGGFMVFELFGL